MISFACPVCDAKFQVKDEFAGQRSKCPKCGQALTVPTQSIPPPIPSLVVPPNSTANAAGNAQLQEPRANKLTVPSESAARRRTPLLIGAGGLLLAAACVSVSLWAIGSFSRTVGSEQSPAISLPRTPNVAAANASPATTRQPQLQTPTEKKPPVGEAAQNTAWRSDFHAFAKAITTAVGEKTPLEPLFSHKSISWVVTVEKVDGNALFFKEAMHYRSAVPSLEVWAELKHDERKGKVIKVGRSSESSRHDWVRCPWRDPAR